MTNGFLKPARIDALKGAEILFYPTAIGTLKMRFQSDGDWHDAWKTIQRAHAIANGIHVAAVNRVGVEGQLSFGAAHSYATPSAPCLRKQAARKRKLWLLKWTLQKTSRFRRAGVSFEIGDLTLTTLVEDT